MATYSSRLRLTLPATGEYTNTWGTVVNDGITALVDDSISGTSAITIAGTDYTLTSVNGSTDEARRMFIVATGTPGAARNVICPAVTKLYSITNNTTGGFALTLKTSAGSGISVPNGATMLLKCDGTNVVQAASTFTDVAYTGTLTGGTGVVNLGAGQFYKDASGNVGVGTASPGYKLTVAGASPTIVAADTGANTTRAYVSATNAQVSYGATYSGGAVPIVFGIGLAAGVPVSEWMRLDASGNLGVGTTSPAVGYKTTIAGSSAWITAGANFTIEPSAASGANGVDLKTSFSSGGNGPLKFWTAGLEQMRLDASGNLLVGTTTANAKLYVSGVAATGLTARFDSTNNTTTPVFQLITSDTTGDSRWQQFYSDGTTLRGSIDYNRAGGLVRYNTTSDYRAKDIIGPVQNPGAAIDALKVYEGQMKGATESRPMLIAHEAQAVAPYAVTGTKDAVDADGNPVYQQIDTSSLVPLLLAELKSLRARVAALEAA